MTNLSSILGDNWSPPADKVYQAPEVQFIDAILESGLRAPRDIVMDGKIHRFASDDDRRKKPGWYIGFESPIPVLVFGCWKAGFTSQKRAETGVKYTPAQEMKLLSQIAEAKKLRDAEQERKHEVAAETIESTWPTFTPASPDHPYLKRKGISAHGARVTGDGRLVVPLFSNDGELSSLQYIDGDGNKLYHTGGITGARFWMIGELKQTLYIAEGFATAATIHEATNEAVCVAYSANNLSNVAGIMRTKYGATQDIVIVADHDVSGVGLNEATKASAKHGVRVVMPPMLGDANDYAQAGNDLLLLLNPTVEDWLIGADHFSEKPQPITWLVKKWLPEQSLIMVHGPSGGGKTFAVLDWTLSIASATAKWAGNKVKAGTVVYLAGEGHQGLKGRVAAWKHKHQIKSLKMWISKSGCDLNTPEGYQKAANQIRMLPHPPSIIVVDTLHRFLLGDENSAQDAKGMLDACAALMREFNCSVLLVHHTGVSEEAQHRARGSSAWRGALDIEISIVPSKDGQPLEIIQRKQKDGELAEPLYARIEGVVIPGWFDEDGEPVKSAVLEMVDAPVKQTASDKVLAKHCKLFEDAWLKVGEDIDGVPYISKSALRDYIDDVVFEGQGGNKPANMVNQNQDGKLINRLIASNMIKSESHGWVVVDQNMANMMRVLKAG
jgi:putative DNA primase/helicase